MSTGGAKVLTSSYWYKENVDVQIDTEKLFEVDRGGIPNNYQQNKAHNTQIGYRTPPCTILSYNYCVSTVSNFTTTLGPILKARAHNDS